MITISKEFYAHVADELIKSVENKLYFSGSFQGKFEDIEWMMTISAIIYYDRELHDFNVGGKITEIVPVWWEYHAYPNGESEILTDFKWNELKEFFNYKKQ